VLFDVGPKLAVLRQGRRLELLDCPPLEPVGNCLGDDRAAARRGVDSGADRSSHLGVIGIGIALAPEGGDAPDTTSIGVAHDPGFAGLLAAGRP
jgi:hypothetical protein